MYYTIIPLIAAMLIASFATYAPPHTAAIVSFVKGEYDPGVIDAAGGKVLEEFKNMEMVYASVPPGAFASLAQNPAVEFVEVDSRFEVAAGRPEPGRGDEPPVTVLQE